MSMVSAVFIDFEGNKDAPPTFLGVLTHLDGRESFRQIILEEAFSVLAPSAQHKQLEIGHLDDVLRELDSTVGPDTPVYAWSSHEQTVINELLVDPELAVAWKERVIDAKKLAKRWARVRYPEHKFERKDFRGRHTLDQYLELIGYTVPTVHGAGKTGSRLSLIREMLANGRGFELWPPSVKKHWTKLLAHNMHDCYGMMALVDRINTDEHSQG